MSIFATLTKAREVYNAVAPWWPVVSPLVDALRDGRVTADEVVTLAKKGMLEATEERLRRELGK